MQTKNLKFEERRHLIFSLSGILCGMLLPATGCAGHAKQKINALMGELDIAALEHAKPVRDPSVLWRTEKNRLRLYRKSHAGHRDLCEMNLTGLSVWKACNGDRTIQDIVRLLKKTYHVTGHQAYLDCLCFLVDLRNQGAIRI